MIDAAEVIREHLIIHFEIDPADLRPEATLAEIGLDSLAMMELFTLLEEQYGIRFPGMAGLGGQVTLAGAVALLERELAVVAP